MKRLTTALLFIFIFFCAMAQKKGDDGQPLRSRLSRDTILVGDQIEWLFDFSLKEGEGLYLQEPEEIPAEGVETIEKMKLDTLSMRRGTAKIQGRSIITAFDSGSFYLPQLIAMIERTNGSVDTLFIDGPVLEVTVPPVDTATFELNDIKGQIRYPVTFMEVLPWVGLTLLIAVLCWLVWRFIKSRRENRSFFSPVKVQDPPHIVALRSLEHTRSQKLWQNGHQKQFYTLVTDALRQYIADRYQTNALEQTSAEMFKELDDKSIDPKLYEKLKELFTTADYVKFAKHIASDNENEEAIPTAIRFVNDTYMQQVETENKDEK